MASKVTSTACWEILLSSQKKKISLQMKKYIAVLLTVTLICSFGLTGCGTNSASNSKEATAENPMVLTLAHGLSESHTVHIAMLQFAEEVKQKTNGRIIIKIFPNGQLGSETENLEQLQAGVIAMTKVSAPGLATYNDAYNTFGLPYIFSNIDEFYKIMDSDKMQDFFLSSEDDGFVTLTYFTSGSRSFYTKDKPIRKPEDLKGIKIGDIVYLNGSMTTCRDVAHRRLVEEGRELPVDVRNNAIFHAGPIIRPLENDKFEMVSVGPTTSMRMEKFEYEFVKETGVRVIIGKGGMKENTERACKEFGAIHCVFPAGNAVVAATEVEEIVRAEWRDLGMPETLWNCRVKEFGPLIVSIDAEGNNWFEQQKVEFNKRKDAATEEICKQVGFIK